MSLKEHLYELRNRLALAILFILLGGIFGFIWFQTDFGRIPSLGDLLLNPYCALPSTARFEATPGVCQLMQTKPFEAFMVQFKVGVATGAVLTSPLWLYQIWAFITPGLYAKERRFALTFVGLGSLLFAAGAVLAYFVVPQGLAVLVSFGGDQFFTSLQASEYISFVLVMLVIFGISFELPLLVVMLNRVGILPYANLKRWRRGMIFGLFVFAAVATPGTDPISMLALAAAMTLLLELAVQVSRAHDRKKARLAAADGLAGLDDDETSPVDPIAPPVEPTRAGIDDVT